MTRLSSNRKFPSVHKECLEIPNDLKRAVKSFRGQRKSIELRTYSAIWLPRLRREGESQNLKQFLEQPIHMHLLVAANSSNPGSPGVR
jgi:hypothetical protein